MSEQLYLIAGIIFFILAIISKYFSHESLVYEKEYKEINNIIFSKLFESIEILSEEVHNAWMDEKRKQGFHAPLSCPIAGGDKFEKHCNKCHTDLYPYSELPENIKEYDRVTVRSVLNAIKKIYNNIDLGD